MNKFETKLEKQLAGVSLILLLLALGAAALCYLYYRAAREEKFRADSQLPYSALTEAVQRPRVVAAQFRPNELIIEFSPVATDADKKRVYQSASVQLSEVLQQATTGSSLSSGERLGEIVLATIKPKNRLTDTQKALKFSVSPIANIQEGDDIRANLPLGTTL